MTRWMYALSLCMAGVTSASSLLASDYVDDPSVISEPPDERLVLTQLEVCPNELPADFYCPPGSPGAKCYPYSLGPEFSASWLYLLPTFDNTYFALDSIASTTFPNGTRVNNDFDFHSAFRVGAGYRFHDDKRLLQVNYTFVDADQSTTIDGDFLWATVGRADFASAFENYAGTASSSLEFTYHRIDASYSQPWQVYDDSVFFRYGVDYANLRLKEDNTFTSAFTTGTIAQESHTVGVGPEFGIGIDHSLFRDMGRMPGSLSMNMLTTASLLISQSSAQVRNVLGTTPMLDVMDENTARIIPALHARVGVNYEFCAWKRQTTFTLGYEFNSYIRALTRITFPDDVADGYSITDYDNCDMQGLFCSATIAY